MKLNVIAGLVMTLPAALAGIVPNREFYLHAESSDPKYNNKPVRGDTAGATLSLKSGNRPKFYLDNGLLGVDYGGTDYFARTAYVNFQGLPNGPCGTNGEVRLVQGPIYRCMQDKTFSLKNNSLHGGKLLFNGSGSFYACSGGNISYSSSPLAGCSAITLKARPI